MATVSGWLAGQTYVTCTYMYMYMENNKHAALRNGSKHEEKNPKKQTNKQTKTRKKKKKKKEKKKKKKT